MFDTHDYVLIVDDDPDARQILQEILNSVDVPTQMAQDGKQALNCIKAAKPSMVFLDLMMPGMSGFDMMARLRGNPTTRDIPVVVVTACQTHQIDMLKLPGVTEVLQKGRFVPKSIYQLIGAVP